MSVAGNQQRTFLSLLDQLRATGWRDRNLPAFIQSLFARHRGFGARDRRLYRELIYTVLRYLPWIETVLDRDPELAVQRTIWLAADLPCTRPLRAALPPDWPPTPGDLAARATFLGTDPLAVLPAWFRSHSPELFQPAELDVQVRRAPLWVRLQTDDAAAVTAEFDRRGWRWRRAEVLPSALRILDEADVTPTESYVRGLIEIQDLGSQLLLESVGIPSGEHWLDACAGAGGKTLQLARLLGPSGHIDAHDIRPAALRELAVRARRSHAANNITILPGAPAGDYDGVLVDAPCSGSGTWRRAPHLKWATTEADLTAAATRQRALLSRFCARVRSGGRLVYATCSISRRENEEVVAAFLSTHPDFSIAPPVRDFGVSARGGGLTFLSARHDTDGFFVASLRRR